ncbi:hypothetical protein JCM10212_004037 [Sporobolomyces blumeae]
MSSFASTLPPPPTDSTTSFSLPVAHPDPSSKPLAPRTLSTDQQRKLDQLIDHFNATDFKLPQNLKDLKAIWVRDGKESGSRFGGLFGGKASPIDDSTLTPLSDVEKCYWSNQAFQRCLRATKWDYANAVKRAEETCVWRREFNVEGMKEQDVSREGETGKELVFGFDVDCRPVLYMHPYRQNTQTGPDQIAFVVWCLERALDLAPATDPATEMLCLCIDFGANLKDTKSQPTTLSQARKVLEILQTYYCERLGKAVCVNIPQIFFAFYKLVSPFVDPVTKEKIRFLEKADATALIPPSQLQTIFGGAVNFEYDHDEYFPALTKLCMERKRDNFERWKKFGRGQCGVDEAVIRGARKVAGDNDGDGHEGLPKEERKREDEVTSGVADLSVRDPPATTATAATESGRDASPSPSTEEGTVVERGTAPEDKPDSTTTGPEEPQTPGLDKFVDAPIASEKDVVQAVPALTA